LAPQDTNLAVQPDSQDVVDPVGEERVQDAVLHDFGLNAQS